MEREGKKKPKANSRGRKFLSNKVPIHSSSPRCRGLQRWDLTEWTRSVCPVFLATEKLMDPRLRCEPQTLIPGCLSPWDQGTLRPAYKGGQYLGWQWYPKLTTSGGRGGVGKGRAKWNAPALTLNEWFNLPDPHVWNTELDCDFTGHHWLNGHEYEQSPGGGEGQGSLTCCSPWGCRGRHDWATERQHPIILFLPKINDTSKITTAAPICFHQSLGWGPDMASCVLACSPSLLGSELTPLDSSDVSGTCSDSC